MSTQLLVVTCLNEYQKIVAGIFQKAKINVYSITNAIGHREGSGSDMLERWFGSGEPDFDSQIIFSFTESTNADQALDLIREQNLKQEEFPIRAFVINIEKSVNP